MSCSPFDLLKARRRVQSSIVLIHLHIAHVLAATQGTSYNYYRDTFFSLTGMESSHTLSGPNLDRNIISQRLVTKVLGEPIHPINKKTTDLIEGESEQSVNGYVDLDWCL